MTPVRKRRQSPEAAIHEAVVDYLRVALPDAVVATVKNEINKSGAAFAREMAQAKRRGIVPGFPDILVLPFSHIGTMLFEVKAPGGYPTETQRAVHERLRALGYRVAVVRSVDDARAALREWGVWTRETGVPQPDAPDGWRSIGEIARGMVRGAVE